MWQVIAAYAVLLGSLGHARHATEVCSDYTPEHSIVMKAAGSQALAVAGTCAHDQGKVFGMACFDKALLKCGVQGFRYAALHEACGGNNVVVADERDRFIDRCDLVLHVMGVSLVSPLAVVPLAGMPDKANTAERSCLFRV